MSVLRMLAIALVMAPVSVDLTAPLLYAQTSTRGAGAAKPKAQPAKKKAPTGKTPLAPTGSADFVVPDEDSWYQEGNVAAPIAPSTDLHHQIGLVGIVNYFGSGVGLEYLYPFTPKTSFGVTLLHTQAELEDDSVDGATEFFDVKSTDLRLYGRYSAFSFLYAAAGFNYLSMAGQYGWKGDVFIDNKIHTNFTAKIAAFDFFLGSEWKGPWSTYAGVDWIGFAVPLSGTIAYEDHADVEATSKIFKSKTPNQRLDEEISAQLRLYYLNLRVGMLF